MCGVLSFDLALFQVKIDTNTKKSRGFGFVRFGDRQVQDRVFEMRNHTIKGRHVDLRFPKQVRIQVLDG